MEETSNRSALRPILMLLLVIVLPIVLGTHLAQEAVPAPQIGVVRLNYDIFSDTAYLFTEQMAYARNDDSIAAVVVIVNSPGGTAVHSEELYLDTLVTRDEKPVLASIELVAASGAYYMAAGANEIYAKPTSAVGSIGVIGFLPGPTFVEKELLTTGPFKAFGGSRDASIRQAERAKFAFLEAVVNGRGDRLEVGPDVLSRAEVYTGIQALDMGMIDGLLSNEEVYARAAELAGIRDYEVVELFPLTFPELFEETEEDEEVDEDEEALADPVVVNIYRPEEIDMARLWTLPEDLPAGLYFRYVDPTFSR